MTAGFVGLDDAIPADNAFIGDGAGQIRNVKAALNTAFPAVQGEINKPNDYGTAATQQPTEADFTQLFTDVSSLVNPQASNSNSIPLGTIVMWSGADWATKKAEAQAIGWYVCDGDIHNGRQTPNLVNKFAKGWNGAGNGGNVGTPSAPQTSIETTTAYNLNTTDPKVAAKDITIAEENLPSHRHNFVLSISESDSEAIRPSDNILAAGTQTMVGAAQSGGYDGEYRLAFDPSRQNAEPDAGKTTKFGNDSPTALTAGLSVSEFEHSHRLDATNVEPASVAVIYLMYCGVI